MDKTFQPANIETRWYEEWEAKGYFAPQGGEKAYSIMIPPPNVTGSLHMGHGFQEALMDALIEGGLLPEAQGAMMRGMTTVFARPGATPDTLETTIEFGAGGSITANGIPLQ